MRFLDVQARAVRVDLERALRRVDRLEAELEERVKAIENVSKGI